MVPAQNAMPTRKEHDANLSLEADSTQNFFLDNICDGIQFAETHTRIYVNGFK